MVNVTCINCDRLMVSQDYLGFACLGCEARIRLSDMIDFKELLQSWKDTPWMKEDDL